MSVDTDPRATEILAEVEAKLGFVPNFFRVMVQSPAATRLYLMGLDILENSSLSPKEFQALQLAVSAYNDCHYCGPAHAKAAQMAGISPEDVQALRAGEPPSDPEIVPAVEAARMVFDKRGWLDEDELRDLAYQGIFREKLFDIVALIGMKMISNYVNHIEGTPVDARFAEED